MDDTLKYCDSVFLDKLYAQILPAAFAAVGLDTGLTSGVQSPHRSWLNGYDCYAHVLGPLKVNGSSHSFFEPLPRDSMLRQSISLFLLGTLIPYMIYFTTAIFCWFFVFDQSSLQNPKVKKNQIRQEIKESLMSLPGMALLHIPIFLLELRGYTRLYKTTADGPGLWYDILSVPFCLAFTETTYYWIHRALHSPALYKAFHKQHHKYVVATPFSGFAFHPVDGTLQGSPFYLFIFLFPLHTKIYVAFFAFNLIYTTILHEGELVNESRFINGSATHTIHHQRLSKNYGQWTLAWDYLAGTYRNPCEDVHVLRQPQDVVALQDEMGRKKTQ